MPTSQSPVLDPPASHLVLGGTRSGKSAFAESAVLEALPSGGQAVYIATAELFDDEMRVRAAAHQATRGTGWRTVETPLRLAEALQREAAPGTALLVDCLSVWLGNLLHHDTDVDAHIRDLLECVPALAAPVVFVSSEVGLGIVPDNALARAYRDRAGILNQQVAAVCDRVTLVAAGLPLTLKTQPER
ncbi:MAG: bifunctional adenosylcobinamide kinase/adenosylcobinamide-phosphate guanylyltransferase [Pseudomonadota bacterium]